MLGLGLFLGLGVFVRLHPTAANSSGIASFGEERDLPNEFIVGILNSRPQQVKACLKQDLSLARSRAQGRIPLAEAVQKVGMSASPDALEVVSLLLGAGADPNTQDRWGVPVLMRACQTRSEELPLMLLAAGADPSLRGQPSRYTGPLESPLLSAVARRYYALAGRLVALGESPDEPGTTWDGRPSEWTPMRAARQSRDQRMIDLLAPYSHDRDDQDVDRGDWE